MHDIPRRTFIKWMGASLPLLGWRWPMASVPEGLAYGLFFDEARLQTMRARFANDPMFAALRATLEGIDRAAERRFIQQEVRFNDHLYDIKRLSDLAPQMAFYYALTGDEDAAQLAIESVRTLMRFPKWDYFQDGTEDMIGIQRASGAVVAVACTIDWLGDLVDADEHRTWVQTMGERGCEPCYRSIYGMRYPDTVRGWRIDPESTYLEHRPYDRVMDLSNWPYILDRTNLKAVPASALAMGAVIAERVSGQTDATARWIEQAVYSIRTFGDLYARDGSYDEGVSYANYTSLHLVQAAEILYRHQGLDLYDVVNWPGYIDYACGMSMPTTDDPATIVNFGDAGTGMHSAVPFLVAARSGDRRAQWFGQHLARGHSEWSLMWYDDAVSAQAPDPGPSLWHSDLDWITARTGYLPDDLVVGMRSGPPANHEHGDRNSIVLKCFGEVLVADPYRPTYNRSDPGWMMRGSAGHSALLIDGQGHQYHDGQEGTNASDAEAKLVRVGERDDYMYWTSDATPAYQLVLPHVEQVTRTIFVLHGLPAVIVLDKVLTDGTAVQLQARYFADNRDEQTYITATDTGFQTTRPYARLQGFAYAKDGTKTTAQELPLPDERAAQNPFAEVATQTAGAAPLLVTVLMPQRLTDQAAEVRFMETEDAVELALTTRGHRLRCVLADTGAIPELRLMA